MALLIKNSHSSCPLCSSISLKKLFVKEAIPYYLCNACYFCFSKPSSNVNFQSDIEGFEGAYIEYFNSSSSDQANFSYLYNWILSWTSLHEKRILDVGCGSGKFIEYMERKGFDIVGLEPSKPLFEKYLRSKGNIYNSSLSNFSELGLQPFDVITLLDVLEHVEDPKQFISQIASIQNDGGYLVIEIPLYESFLSKIMGSKWHFFNKYHLSYFSKDRLVRLLAENGYQLVRSKFRGKYFRLDYLINYLNHFMGIKIGAGTQYSFTRRSIYFNSFDILVASFKKVS